ncbi:MAG: hypothetical protein H7343_05740 [Undibacterium sp.]|nr:hypothetical protein [Opitutaceae bacterium]
MNAKKSSGPSRKSTRLVWIVVAVFALQIAAWAAWITFASKHRVAEVPLVKPG